jgi:hypothetical protein
MKQTLALNTNYFAEQRSTYSLKQELENGPISLDMFQKIGRNGPEISSKLLSFLNSWKSC